MKMIMKINYSEILKKNMINVFKDVLLEIEKNGLQEGHHLYINFNTNNAKVEIGVAPIVPEIWNELLKTISGHTGNVWTHIKLHFMFPENRFHDFIRILRFSGNHILFILFTEFNYFCRIRIIIMKSRI